MAGRFEGMSDAHWDVLKKLLPPEPEKRGRGMPHASFRCVLNSIFYVLITGCRWCDLPPNQDVFAPKSSAHRWLTRWQQEGVLERLSKDIVVMADLAALLDWSNASVDGSFSPGKGGGEGVAYGYKGKGVTIHSIVDANGRPIGLRSTPANSSEREEVEFLVDALPVKPHALQADKGYDAHWLRWWLEHCRNIKARIAKRERPKPKHPTPIAGSTRWRVERAFAWYQRKYRRVNIKWERKWSPWMGLLNLALIHYWVTVLVG